MSFKMPTIPPTAQLLGLHYGFGSSESEAGDLAT